MHAPQLLLIHHVDGRSELPQATQYVEAQHETAYLTRRAAYSLSRYWIRLYGFAMELSALSPTVRGVLDRGAMSPAAA